MSEEETSNVVDAIAPFIAKAANRTNAWMLILAFMFGCWLTRQSIETNHQSEDLAALRSEIQQRRTTRDAQFHQLEEWIADINRRTAQQDKQIASLEADVRNILRNRP